MVAPFVSKWKFGGRCAETGSLSRSIPCSDSLIISAAITVFVMLAMPNCELTLTGCTPSAVPAAPDHAPWPATNTVAVTPGSTSWTAASRTACRAALVEAEADPLARRGSAQGCRPHRPGTTTASATGLEPAGVEEVHALVNNPTTTTTDIAALLPFRVARSRRAS